MMEAAGWIRANACPLRTLEHDDDDFDFADLAPLAEVVGDARVVAIGESDHFVHEFLQFRHRAARFLMAELGFDVYALESGFPEGFEVDDWVGGAEADIDHLMSSRISYAFGMSAELRQHLAWMRSWNETHGRSLHFYGVDLPVMVHPGPAVKAALAFLDRVDAEFAGQQRARLQPTLDRLRVPLGLLAPAAYQKLEPQERVDLTACIAMLVSRLEAGLVSYASHARTEELERALQLANAARRADANLSGRLASPRDDAVALSHRDAGMAANVEWILQRHKRIIIGGHNLHMQRWPVEALPMTTLGQFLHRMLGKQFVTIGTTYGFGERLQFHNPDQPLAGAKATRLVRGMAASRMDAPVASPGTVDALLRSAGTPVALLDLSVVPSHGPVRAAFDASMAMMAGGWHTPPRVDTMTAFDALVYVDEIQAMTVAQTDGPPTSSWSAD